MRSRLLCLALVSAALAAFRRKGRDPARRLRRPAHLRRDGRRRRVRLRLRAGRGPPGRDAAQLPQGRGHHVGSLRPECFLLTITGSACGGTARSPSSTTESSPRGCARSCEAFQARREAVHARASARSAGLGAEAGAVAACRCSAATSSGAGRRGEAGGELLRAGIKPDPVAYRGSNEMLLAPGPHRRCTLPSPSSIRT